MGGPAATPEPLELPPLPADVSVAVVIPARWAERTLPGCLRAILPQLRPGDELVVVAADAPSAAAARSMEDDRVRVVDNPDRTIAPALNRGIAATDRPVIVRADAQSRLPDGYRDRVVELLVGTGAAVVGGRQVPSATEGFAASVAAAMLSPLGHGGARYRSGTAGGPVDTVYLGVFRRDVLEQVGGFDERFLTNEDAELNERIRRAGGTVWLDPTLGVAYLPRGDVGALWRQFRGYGQGRARTAVRHPGSLRGRQLAAPALVVALAGSLAVVPWTFGPFALLAGGYGALVLSGAVAAARRGPARTLAVAVALMTMHLAWGAGFLAARLRPGGPLGGRAGKVRR